MARDQKHCRVCGRRMMWRKRWRRNWDDVVYCSKACRRRGLTDTDRKLEAAIVNLLKQRRAGSGIHPDEAVAVVAGHARHPERILVVAARNAARRLYRQRIVDILQQGRPVDPSIAKGPFYIRLRVRA